MRELIAHSRVRDFLEHEIVAADSERQLLRRDEHDQLVAELSKVRRAIRGSHWDGARYVLGSLRAYRADGARHRRGCCDAVVKDNHTFSIEVQRRRVTAQTLFQRTSLVAGAVEQRLRHRMRECRRVFCRYRLAMRRHRTDGKLGLHRMADFADHKNFERQSVGVRDGGCDFNTAPGDAQHDIMRLTAQNSGKLRAGCMPVKKR